MCHIKGGKGLYIIFLRSTAGGNVYSWFLFSRSLPHLMPDYIQQQYNPPPFNYADPALQYMSHCSPRVLDNVTPRQRPRQRHHRLNNGNTSTFPDMVPESNAGGECYLYLLEHPVKFAKLNYFHFLINGFQFV